MTNTHQSIGQTLCSKISSECLKKFENLGKNGKPVKNEWSVLACIVQVECKKNCDDSVEVVALGTGSKCLGRSELPINGDKLHDSHGEIIAQRAFKLYLLHQLDNAIEGRKSIFNIGEKGFTLKEDISFHLYCSSVPCGDASIFPINEENQNWIDSSVGPLSVSMERSSTDLLSKRNSVEEPLLKKVRSDEASFVNNNNDIHRTGAKCVPCEYFDSKEPGTNYHTTGVLRTKPGRGDPTLSHCCSDKMFKWNVLGIQGGILMLFLTRPIYLQTIIIGNELFNLNAMQRALYERFDEQLYQVKINWPYFVKTPDIMTLHKPFKYSKMAVTQNASDKSSKVKPSPTSIIWSLSTVHLTKAEVSVEGKKLGTSKKNESSLKSRVSICRVELMRKVLDLIETIKKGKMEGKFILEFVNKFSISSSRYEDLKEASVTYNQVWQELKDNVLVHWVKKPSFVKQFSVDSCVEKKISMSTST